MTRSSGTQRSIFGRCDDCGHLALVEGAASGEVYSRAGYYSRRDGGGAGYASYLAEREYREHKGGRLLDRIIAATGRTPASLLEVGSGFGFTRQAAADRRIPSVGVDVNPYAAQSALDLYGFRTFTGTLAQALDEEAIRPGAFDLVLHQFVLEHIPDPIAELSAVARALAPGGFAAAWIPSAEAVELEVFGAAYRSLRHDHLHLFSRRSIARAFRAAGLTLTISETDCSLHLLRGFLDDAELRALYASGRGPDLLALAHKEPS
ncbi:class I SAM-dependent methyltransferase [Pendulispora albinea]|uniref:Class I SAM-dependent methyltransferase n=1 Tax=Pendulispora albinea TaxID=2741071 RepID=A0ABZ2LL19_9BACT